MNCLAASFLHSPALENRLGRVEGPGSHDYLLEVWTERIRRRAMIRGRDGGQAT